MRRRIVISVVVLLLVGGWCFYSLSAANETRFKEIVVCASPIREYWNDGRRTTKVPTDKEVAECRASIQSKPKSMVERAADFTARLFLPKE